MRFLYSGYDHVYQGLLDRNPDPTEEEIKYALRNNYCRCTGYVKIIAPGKAGGKDHACR